MKLVYTHNNKEVKVGDIIIGMNGEKLKVNYFAEPHKPSSSGKITMEHTDVLYHEGYVCNYNMRWIEREDRGWVSPELQIVEVGEIYKSMFGVDISGYDLDDFTQQIREVEMGNVDDPDKAKILVAWLIGER